MYMRVPLDDEGRKIEAGIVAETDSSPAALAFANQAAEAHSLLLHVRRAKRHLVECYLGSEEDSETSGPLSSGRLTTTLRELAALDRYERRAISRRDRAMRNAFKAKEKL